MNVPKKQLRRPAEAGAGAGRAATSVPSTTVLTDKQFLALPSKDLVVIEPAAQGAAKGAIRVGDRVRIQVEGVDRPGAKVALAPGAMHAAPTQPAGGASSAPENSSINTKDPLQDSGLLLLTDGKGTSPLIFEVVVLKPGEVILPSLAIVDGDAQGAPAGTGAEPFARTQPLRLQSESAIAKDDPKPQEAVGLREPMRLPYPTEIVVAGGALALLLLSLVGWAVWKWLRKRAALKPALKAPLKSEDEIAIDKLVAIEKAGFAERGEFKKHYFGISEALKEYIGARYGFNASEMTSEEILTRLNTSAYVGEKVALKLGSLFLKLDVVKFTDRVPESREPGEVLGTARQLVQETRRARVTHPVAPSTRIGASGGGDAVR